jgi:TrmH family RNA methyltransferase
MITSPQNPKVQLVRALQSRSRNRRKQGAFVVEGVRLAEEALGSGWQTRFVFHTGDLDERGEAVVQAFAQRGVQVEMVSDDVMGAVSDTITPQGILAVLDIRSIPLPKYLDFVFIPDGVRDPGNLGTMLRTAAAAGIDAFLLPSGVVDPFSPKVVRAAMGAHFQLPIHILSWSEIGSILERYSLQVYVASAGEGQVYTQVDFRHPLALVVGGEAAGAGIAALQLADARVHIPMPGKVESLNTAAAAAILLFEVLRQRRVR